jgi:hypothetical protein
MARAATEWVKFWNFCYRGRGNQHSHPALGGWSYRRTIKPAEAEIVDLSGDQPPYSALPQPSKGHFTLTPLSGKFNSRVIHESGEPIQVTVLEWAKATASLRSPVIRTYSVGAQSIYGPG